MVDLESLLESRCWFLVYYLSEVDIDPKKEFPQTKNKRNKKRPFIQTVSGYYKLGLI